MNAGDNRAELMDLLGALANESMTAAQHQRLEQLLGDDPQARQLYLDYMDVHFGLHGWSLRDEERLPLDELRRQLEQHEAVTPEPAAPAGLPLRLRYALVAAVTLAASLLMQFVWPHSEQSQLGAADRHPSDYVATLARAVDCHWNADDAGLREGSRLLPDEIELDHGVAEILFDGGTQLILEGPARLRVESAGSATLAQGRAVLKTDETAEPFTLITPQARLVNTSAEYGAAVGPAGEIVQAFDGEVRRELQAVRPDGQQESESILPGPPRRYGRANPATPVLFVRHVPPRNVPRDPSAGLLAYDGFDYSFDGLGFAEGTGVGWAGPWRVPPDGPMMFDPYESLLRPNKEDRSIGGSLGHHGAGAIQRVLARPIRLDQDGVYYLSFLFRRDAGAAKAPSTFLLALFNQRQPESHQRLAVGVAGPNHVVFTNLGGGGVRVPLALEYEKTYLMVGKIVAGRKSPDQLFFRIFRPDETIPAREPANWSMISRPVRSDLVFDALGVQINSQSRQSLDELRIGASWSSVAAIWGK